MMGFDRPPGSPHEGDASQSLSDVLQNLTGIREGPAAAFDAEPASRGPRPLPTVRSLLEEMIQRKASDIYLCTDQLPRYRVFGEVITSTQHSPDQQFMIDLVREVAGEKGLEAFLQTGDIDVSYGVSDLGRFRVNFYKQRHGIGTVFRHIPTAVPNLDDLYLPPSVAEFIDFGHGLVIVTGPTGSGKTTTLAALIKTMADRYPLHIVTVENPIEFHLDSDVSLIVQREVGLHTPSFARALKDALREDIDVLMIGELRDLETIELALKAAEMGMLVFCTLHTTNSAKAISRIIDVFPAEEQDQVRMLLAETLRGVLAQQLCLRADGPGRIACGEVLLSSPSLSYLIREGKSNQIHSTIQTGREAGMITMDQALIAHYMAGRITLQEIYDRAHRPEDLASQGLPPPPSGYPTARGSA
ncbi:MAG: PilT/PilU family type 4a pilus ATPase [Armatimonadetes bacterium]|nr:PilT/PilU family type 4a pilus ATPase [Armatimonadota bacterium]